MRIFKLLPLDCYPGHFPTGNQDFLKELVFSKEQLLQSSSVFPNDLTIAVLKIFSFSSGLSHLKCKS